MSASPLHVRKCGQCGDTAPHYEGTTRCVECHKARSRAYYRRNRERVLARITAYDKINRPEKTRKPTP